MKQFLFKSKRGYKKNILLNLIYNSNPQHHNFSTTIGKKKRFKINIQITMVNKKHLTKEIKRLSQMSSNVIKSKVHFMSSF